MEAIVWLGLLIVFLIVEIITVGLTSIWLAGGAVAALVLYLLGVGIAGQIAAFFMVSILLMVFTRPFAVRFINQDRTKTNYEEVIGKTVRISEPVDNLKQTGKAVVNGMEWTVRSEDSEKAFAEGEMAEVVRVEGVKLIVR